MILFSTFNFAAQAGRFRCTHWLSGDAVFCWLSQTPNSVNKKKWRPERNPKLECRTPKKIALENGRENAQKGMAEKCGAERWERSFIFLPRIFLPNFLLPLPCYLFFCAFCAFSLLFRRLRRHCPLRSGIRISVLAFPSVPSAAFGPWD